MRYTTSTPKSKIGFFGGTFDPPHIGHLILASEAAHQFGLTRLLWVLNPDPPHKQEMEITPLEHRLQMLKRAISDNPTFELSRLEIDRPGPHFTINTIRYLIQHEPDAELFLLIGGDSLRDLPTWRFPSEIVAAVSKISVMRRPGDSFDMAALESRIPGITDKVSFIDALLLNLSSREIRRRVAAGDEYRYYVHPSVYEYILANRLYREK
ncbi:MAG: nicotinate (nicotinamide) nucleotide adenylyltransferase [Anaerolineales bacterium]|nr:nicotinate (nicotinamide) nucleotide adenylyltransferase [Anaerolineales bacterium]